MRFLLDMPSWFTCYLCFVVTAIFFSFITLAQGQDRVVGQDEIQLSGEGGMRYGELCYQHRIDCTLSYGNRGVVEPKKKPSTSRLRLSDRSDYNLVTIVLLCVGFLVILGLWFYFGSGGMLLARGVDNKTKRHDTTPAGWNEDEERPYKSTVDFFQHIALMSNRREALVELLRYCLLHAARLSDTRLARADTERAVLRRLPDNLPQRNNLETLLRLAERAHYGGEEVEEQQFIASLALARDFVLHGQPSHA